VLVDNGRQLKTNGRIDTPLLSGDFLAAFVQLFPSSAMLLASFCLFRAFPVFVVPKAESKGIFCVGAEVGSALKICLLGTFAKRIIGRTGTRTPSGLRLFTISLPRTRNLA
jgi:hypothetical protein